MRSEKACEGYACLSSNKKKKKAETVKKKSKPKDL